MKNLLIIFLFLACRNRQQKETPPLKGIDTNSKANINIDKPTIDLHDACKNEKDTTRLNKAIVQIFKFPEVQVVNKQLLKNSKGKHGVAFMTRDQFGGDTAFYWFEVGDNSRDDRYVNIFNFLLEKKTGQIKAFDTMNDSIMSLKDWRKTRN